MVDTIGDDMLEVVEPQNGNICDDSDSRCGQEHEMVYVTCSLFDALEQNNKDNTHIYVYLNQPMAKKIL